MLLYFFSVSKNIKKYKFSENQFVSNFKSFHNAKFVFEHSLKNLFVKLHHIIFYNYIAQEFSFA